MVFYLMFSFAHFAGPPTDGLSQGGAVPLRELYGYGCSENTETAKSAK